jgi:hypothetical protein
MQELWKEWAMSHQVIVVLSDYKRKGRKTVAEGGRADSRVK